MITEFWKNHGTKVLGGVQMVQGVVAGFMGIMGLIPPAHLPYWALANVLLGAVTVNRGFINSIILKNTETNVQ
jgi:hypothetical protein